MSRLFYISTKPKDVYVQLQKIQLIEATASLIKSEIKEVTLTTRDIYPSFDKLSRKNFVLRAFFATFVINKNVYRW